MKVHDLLDPAADSLLIALKKRREREAQKPRRRRWLARLRAIGAAVVRWHLWEPAWGSAGRPEAKPLDTDREVRERIQTVLAELDAREVLVLLMGSSLDEAARCDQALLTISLELSREPEGRVH